MTGIIQCSSLLSTLPTQAPHALQSMRDREQTTARDHEKYRRIQQTKIYASENTQPTIAFCLCASSLAQMFLSLAANKSFQPETNH
jgi:hypothetical protein